uniref:Transcription regulator, PspC family n=1 Tax=uncultured crenarchaeote TaxID=29281 RepID=H5SGE4_9CREN|nr:transcription regulator, PspC family [uncultured crenarchaeote]
MAGVFGGLGEYLNVDPNLLRLVGVILLIVSPALMIVLYTFAALLIPRRGGVSPVSPTVDMARVGPVIVGLVLLLVGMWLMGNAPLFILGYPFLRITFATVAGLIIAVIGLVILVDNLKKI